MLPVSPPDEVEEGDVEYEYLVSPPPPAAAQICRPVTSPKRVRTSSVSAEDTVLLRRKFEFQSPNGNDSNILSTSNSTNVVSGNTHINVLDSNAEEEIVHRSPNSTNSQGDELLTKKHSKQRSESVGSMRSPVRGIPTTGTTTMIAVPASSKRPPSPRLSHNSGPWEPGGVASPANSDAVTVGKSTAVLSSAAGYGAWDSDCSPRSTTNGSQQVKKSVPVIATGVSGPWESEASVKIASGVMPSPSPVSPSTQGHPTVPQGIHLPMSYSSQYSRGSSVEPGSIRAALSEASAGLIQRAEELARLAATIEDPVPDSPMHSESATTEALRGANMGLRRRVDKLERELSLAKAKDKHQQYQIEVEQSIPRQRGDQISAQTADKLVQMQGTLRELREQLHSQRQEAMDMKRSWVFLREAFSKQITEFVKKEVKRAADKVQQGNTDRILQAEAMFAQADSERRKLHQQLQQLRGTIRVVARIRPLLESERHETFAPRIALPDAVSLDRSNGQRCNFQVDAVLPPDSTQSDLFNEVDGVSDSVLDGRTCCVIAYGQTGSGKTHSMLGEFGVVVSLLTELFDKMKQRESLGGFKYKLFVSISEVYNENASDLLSHIEIEKKHGEHFGTEFEIKNSQVDIAEILLAGERARSVGVSNINIHSSRSHCAILARVEGTNIVTRENLNGQVYLVDLAGSERIPTHHTIHGSIKTSNPSSNLLKETQHINRSLSALGNVISALACGSNYVPYRNSRLTHMLQPCLKKGSKVVMITTVSPAASATSESICTLQFASRARTVHLGSPQSVRSSASRNGRSRSAPNYH